MILPVSFDFLESIAPKKSCKPYKKNLYLVFSPLFTFECIKNIFFLLKRNWNSDIPYLKHMLLGCCMALFEFVLFHRCNFLSRKIICRRYVFVVLEKPSHRTLCCSDGASKWSIFTEATLTNNTICFICIKYLSFNNKKRKEKEREWNR